MELADIFRETLKHVLKSEPRGAQSNLADELGIPRTSMSDFLNGRKPLSETKREQIAKYLGYRYEEFIALGRQLTGNTGGVSPETEAERAPIPIDTETRILQEAIAETGVKLSSRQKEAVVKILRKEMRKNEGRTKDHILNYLTLLKQEAADGR